MDERSERNVTTLHPKVQNLARTFYKAANSLLERDGFEMKIISGTRTYAEQDALYAQGRTAKGNKVTNAKGGYSWHNFGIAFDIGLFKDGKYFGDHKLYSDCGLLGKSLGLEWGGDWKSFPDRPHFQVRTGLTLAQMRERVNAKQDILT
jgi:peptidoglycan L-alanyl-D-glutamate endopeptidase CwlK